MKQLKRPTWVFLQGDVDDILELFAKNEENKEKLKRILLKILNWYDLSRVEPCERARPQLSEYVWNIVVSMI